MRILLKFCLLCLIFISFAAVAKADPIRIITGNSTNVRDNMRFSIFGEDGSQFSVSDTITAFVNKSTYSPTSSIQPIIEMFALSGVPNSPLNSGRGLYRANGFNTLAVYFNSSMIFAATESFRLPAITSVNFETFTATVPFSMQGILNAVIDCEGGNPRCNQPLPAVSIYGNGLAQFSFYSSGTSGVWNLATVAYTFATPEPTPEPATLLLMGTGLAGIIGLAKRRKRAKAA